MADGKRVIAVAQQIFDWSPSHNWTGKTLDDLSFPSSHLDLCGLFALADPPKDGVREAVLRSQAAGVKVVMITGDAPETAKAIARQIGLIREQDLSTTWTAVEGTDIQKHSPEHQDFTDHEPVQLVDFWKRIVEDTRVFARVSPMDKQTIVQAYQKWGHQVAS